MMTRKQINSLRRKIKIGAVIGATAYFVAGVTSFGNDLKKDINVSDVSVVEPVSIIEKRKIDILMIL